ncbi:MAG: alpha/beta fold hydrolase, partial [Deferrisomatales bacterium]|nr:alpha/beta fold hydrolase [Deferrisomatales bacterium]
MDTGTISLSFSRAAAAGGAAAGITITGKQNPAAASGATTSGPLIVALHGGTYTSDYFDIAGHSLLELAESKGIPVIALDRPAYGGSTPLGPSDSIIAGNAVVLDAVIADIWNEWSGKASGIVLIGHSIGGAIVTDIAGNQPSWPLKGIAVSGCLLQIPAESADTWDNLPDIPMIDLPTAMKDQVMFGPEGTFGANMPAASYPSNAPCPRSELIDITSTWIARVREVAARVTVPVHSRQAEFDRLWITDAQQVADFGA